MNPSKLSPKRDESRFISPDSNGKAGVISEPIKATTGERGLENTISSPRRDISLDILPVKADVIPKASTSAQGVIRSPSRTTKDGKNHLVAGDAHDSGIFPDDSSASIESDRFISPIPKLDNDRLKRKFTGKRRMPPRMSGLRSPKGLENTVKTIVMETENRTSSDSPTRSGSSTESNSNSSHSAFELVPIRPPGEFDSTRTDSELTLSSGGSGKRNKSPALLAMAKAQSGTDDRPSLKESAKVKLDLAESPKTLSTDEESKEMSTPRRDIEDGQNDDLKIPGPENYAALTPGGAQTVGDHTEVEIRLQETRSKVVTFSPSSVSELSDDPETGLVQPSQKKYQAKSSRNKPLAPMTHLSPELMEKALALAGSRNGSGKDTRRQRRRKKRAAREEKTGQLSSINLCERIAEECAWLATKITASDLEEPEDRRIQQIANAYFALFMALLLMTLLWMLRIFPDSGGFPT